MSNPGSVRDGKKPGAVGETDKLERVKFSPDNIG